MKKKRKEAIEMGRNWADLPSEVFLLILENLPDISDFVRFRAVCKSWRFSSSISDLPPQFPWILKLSEGPELEFYSIAFNKVYTIRVRCSSGKKLFRPAGGYVLSGEEGNAGSFSLLNPLNNGEVALPVLDNLDPYTFPGSFWLFSHVNFHIDDYIIISEEKISVRCKPGDEKWDIIGPGHGCQYSCFCFRGMLFRVDGCTKVTKIMDISSRRELHVIQPPKYEKLHNMHFEGPDFVDSCGEILTVCYNQSFDGMDYKFYIHRLEFCNAKGNPYWVKLTNIGDQILFFDFPFGTGRGSYLKASDFCGFKGNCIYFTNIVRQTFGSDYFHKIFMYDIENGETILIDSPFDWVGPITWFMPTITHV